MSNRSLLPPNSTPAERAAEATMSRIGLVPTPLRQLWDADTCPAPLLPWLAWALSIDAWKSYWPENVKRAVIRTAIDIQRRKGTAKSVRDVVAAFGGSVVMREWWEQSPPGAPHTFDLVMTITGEDGEPASAQFVDDVIAEVQRTKPVRSHFNFTQGVEMRGGVGIGAGVRIAVYRRLQFTEAQG